MPSISAQISEPAGYVRPHTASKPLKRGASKTSGGGRAYLALGPILFGLVTLSTLAFAWTMRDEGLLRADRGTGYWLGIVGTIIMVVLFTYPLRKRFPSLAFIGRVATWFRLHMVLGIVGPTMIVLHSNFNLGPVNSKLAFLSMLVVVGSGLVGRYLHARVHNGLYGQRDEVKVIAGRIEGTAARIAQVLPRCSAIAELGDLSAAGISPGRMSPGRVRRMRRRLRGALKGAEWINPGSGVPLSKAEKAAGIRKIDSELRVLAAAMAKVRRLGRYEWLLSTWHLLHIPLLVLLFLTVILHIVAVELY